MEETAMKAAMKRGFTIVELLVVITIIGILMAMLFPALNTARNVARRSQCTNRQRQLGQGMLTYALTSSSNRFPGWKQNITPDPKSGSTTPFEANWVIRILPQIEANSIFTFISKNPAALTADPLDTNTPQNNRLPRLDTVICPANPPVSRLAPVLSYVANTGVTGGETHDKKWTGVFFDHTVPLADRVNVGPSYISKYDGTTNTIMLSESIHQKYWNNQGINLSEVGVGLMWDSAQDTSGDSANYDTWEPPVSSAAGSPAEKVHMLPSSRHPGVFVMTFCDGHTKAVSENIRFRVYHYLMTSNGQEKYAKESNAPLSAAMLEP
jgi:prepilin-type N-terminal cleavage/methylation domain-containing protein/prepilin-type processing-associated H-X9-DG protein